MKTFEITIGGVKYYVRANNATEAENILRNSQNATVVQDKPATSKEVDEVPEGVGFGRNINPTTAPNFYGTEGPLPQFSGFETGEDLSETRFLEEFLPDFTSPFTQFRSAFQNVLPNINIRSGIGQSLASTAAAPSLASFYAQQAMRPETPLGGLQATVGTNPFRQAANTFQNLLGAARQGVSRNNDFLNALISPTLQPGRGVSQNFGARQAAELARGAARDRFGSLFANAFVPQTNTLLREFEESPQFGDATGFLPFLQQRLGLA